MPYINQTDKATSLNSPGKLNYHIHILLGDYFKDHGVSYSTINNVIGLLHKINTNQEVLDIPDALYLLYKRINNLITDFHGSRGTSQYKVADLSITGVLRCVELELYRRLAAPYEDLKKIENGDIPIYENN